MSDYKDLTKIVCTYLIITLCFFLLIVVSTMNAIDKQTTKIINHIEKHSIHPTHGNFQDVSYTPKCSPWDACQ